MALRWLFLDMNSFFASVEQQEHPVLRGQPVAVVPMLSDSTCCIAASYEAKAFGVRTGTRVGEARRLCPGLRLIEARHGPYRAYHDEIIRVVGQFLPIDKVLSVDEMVCRLCDNERSPDAAHRLGAQIKTRIAQEVGECLRCSVGVSLNPFLAKVAAGMQKPDGLTLLEEREVPHGLFGLRLTDFPGISRAMEVRFQDAHVFDTEQMYKLSCPQMRRVWGGVRGELWWHLIRGHAVTEPPPVRRSVGHSHVLPLELRTPQGAAAVIGRLLEKAAERMRSMGYFARGLSVHVRSLDSQVWERKKRLTPCQDTWTLLGVLRALGGMPCQEPLQVAVVLYDLIPEADVTLPLFDEAGRRLRAAQSVDEINRRYGRGTLSMARAALVSHTGADKIAFGKISDLL